jgi:RimJ/RimL family protein N-acetyltransferase
MTPPLAVRIPVLETERLLLRGPHREDFAELVAIWSDPNVIRYISGKPSTDTETWTRLTSMVGHWALMGFGNWSVEEKATGRCLGMLGFADYKRDPAALRGFPEAGWALATHAHGRGYATEGLRAALAWADRAFPSPRTVCAVHPENLKSIRVAEKCGYREFSRGSHKDMPLILFSREGGAP